MSESGRRAALVPTALVLSGGAALVYENAWGRMLHRVLGVSDWAVATVVASFFLGMGLGAAVGGRWARRTRAPVRAYAALEVGVAAYALLSIPLVPRLAAVVATLGPDVGFGTLSAVRWALSMLVLLPPTIAMGATLPLLLAAHDGRTDFTQRMHVLYGANTLGAAVGAALTGFVLLPRIGVSASVASAALGSLGAAALGMVSARGGGPHVGRVHDSGSAAQVAEDAGDPHAQASTLDTATRLTTGLAFAAGALSLGGEVLFTRLLRLVVQATSVAFAAMLTTYLVGIVAGTALAAHVRRRRAPLMAFGAMQLFAGAAVVYGIALAPLVPRAVGLLRGEAELIPHEPWVMLVVSLALLAPIATLVGTGLPLVTATLAERSASPGAMGRLFAANTLGGLVGALAAGFLSVPALGLEASLYLLVVAHAALAGVALLAAAGDDVFARTRGLLALGALVTGLFVLRPSIELPFLLDAWNDPTNAIVTGARGYDEEPLVYLREGRNTTVSILDRNGTLRLFNDGRPESGIGRAAPLFGPELVLLGGLPALFAGARDRAMIVGLGAGHSATMALAGGFERVDVVELETAVVDAARRLHRMRGQPFPLDDARARWTVDDARARLALAEPGSYDAIVSQPSHPWLAGSSALYTREFFSQSARALRPTGVLTLWVNVFRMDVRHLRDVVHTLSSVFPHVAAFAVEESSFLLVASQRPLAYDEVGPRIDATPRLRTLLSDYRLASANELLATLELDEAGVRAFGASGTPLVDDVPRLEYGLTSLPHGSSLTPSDLDAAFAQVPWMSRATASRLPPELREHVAMFRLARLEGRRVGIHRVERAVPAMGLDPPRAALHRGAALELLGDVRGALAAYGGSDDAESAARADALRRLAEGPEATLRVARARRTLPFDADAILRAAFETGAPDDLRFGARMAAERAETTHAGDTRLATAYARGGCAAALEAARPTDAREVERLAFLARCARDVGDEARARALDDRRAATRRTLAQSWFTRGRDAQAGGNTALAAEFHRRALAVWPAHRDAAEARAEALCALDHCETARLVLESTLAAMAEAGDDDSTLRDVGTRLGLGLR